MLRPETQDVQVQFAQLDEISDVFLKYLSRMEFLNSYLLQNATRHPQRTEILEIISTEPFYQAVSQNDAQNRRLKNSSYIQKNSPASEIHHILRHPLQPALPQTIFHLAFYPYLFHLPFIILSDYRVFHRAVRVRTDTVHKT